MPGTGPKLTPRSAPSKPEGTPATAPKPTKPPTPKPKPATPTAVATPKGTSRQKGSSSVAGSDIDIQNPPEQVPADMFADGSSGFEKDTTEVVRYFCNLFMVWRRR
jgi:hypothetical protein